MSAIEVIGVSSCPAATIVPSKLVISILCCRNISTRKAGILSIKFP